MTVITQGLLGRLLAVQGYEAGGTVPDRGIVVQATPRLSIIGTPSVTRIVNPPPRSNIVG
jgi:hypothetical protein